MSLCVPHTKYGIKENKQEFLDGNALTFILLKFNLDPFLLSFFCVQGTSFFPSGKPGKKTNNNNFENHSFKKGTLVHLKGNVRRMNDKGKRNYLEQHILHSSTPK